MKAKKALKRLNKVEGLLSDIIDQFPKRAQGLGELLDSAKTAVVQAMKSVNSQLTKPAKKPPASAQKVQPGRLTPEGRQKISMAAKKRWAHAKRNGVNPVTGRRLKKTA